jgi:glucose-6-phosphate isomerase
MKNSLQNVNLGLRIASPEIANVTLEWSKGTMTGAPVQESVKKLSDLQQIFLDEAARERMNQDRAVYRVQWWAPVPPGDEGGLFWGVTTIYPGKVGEEYFMTHGHSHANRTRAEYYTPVSGQGLLIRMDEQRSTWAEQMTPGTLHYLRGEHAHRVVNTGAEPLIFWACWGSDAGYDYGAIKEHGFGARVLERDGRPAVILHE